ncbi:MAG: hypothetical protein ABFC96_18670 [Thermoguttaceae bacterium]
MDSAFFDQLRIPQFGIIHLLGWMTVTAVVLKTELAISVDQSSNGSAVLAVATKVWMILTAIVSSCEFVAASVLVRAKWRARQRPLQPGHWLVLLGAIGSVLGISLFVMLRLVFGERWQGTRAAIGIWMAAGIVISALFALGYLLAAVSLRDRQFWKIALAVVGVISISQTLCRLVWFLPAQTLFQYGWQIAIFRLANYLPSCTVLALIAAVIVDLPHRRQRDWVHWVGLLTLIAGATVTVAGTLLSELVSKAR